MRHLILVRHSQPDIVSGVPGSLWHLSVEGRRRCRFLAEQLASYRPAAIVTSREPKALETASLLSTHLSVPYTPGEGLHEHERGDTAYLGREEWEQTIASFFAHPDQLVFGNETATQALQRFTKAVENVQQEYDQGTVAIVTHGTVITLFVAQHARTEPFPLWTSLDTPAFFVLAVPSYTVLRSAPQIDLSA